VDIPRFLAWQAGEKRVRGKKRWSPTMATWSQLTEDADVSINIVKFDPTFPYDHWNTMTVEEPEIRIYREMSGRREEEIEAAAKEVQERLEELVPDVSRKLQKKGYKYIDDMFGTDEAVLDYIRVQEYEFYKDGRLV
jgi:hypothetical protein